MEEELYRVFLVKIKTALDMVQLDMAMPVDAQSFIGLVTTHWTNRVELHVQEALDLNDSLQLLDRDTLLGRLGLLIDQALTEFKQGFAR